MKHLIAHAAAAIGAAFAVAPAAGQGRAPVVVAVTADRMLDVLAGTEILKPVVVITDGRISAVGRQGEVAIPAGARLVDLPGRTILPGLIDMHVHLTSLAEIGGYRGFEYTDSFWGAVGVANAGKTLRAGFTTVRNVGADAF
ncbi:MAG: amidohydrolase family protein, partial [Alphaproteobacteria bacterium]|nr:amidohydrolase family protein [Alphaproteobacteria bacterium]